VFIRRFFRGIFRLEGGLEKRLFWFIALMSLLIEVVCIVTDLLNGFGYYMMLVNAAAMVITFLTMGVAWKTEKYGIGYVILCLLINLAIVPTALLNGGGFASGMACYVVLGLLMCAVNLDTKKRLINVGIAMAGYIVFYIIVKKNPWMITQVSKEAMILNTIIAVFVSVVIISWTLSMLVRDIQKVHAMNVREYGARTRMRLELLESQADNIEEAKRQRSEMRRHNMIITEYAEKGDFDGLLQYLTDKNAVDERYNKKAIYCMNATINTVLGIYTRQAMQKKVPMELKTDVSQELPIPEPELVSVVSNVLENAINVAEQAAAPERIVMVDIHTKSEKLVINCKYSCDPALAGEREFTGHSGVGIEIVDRLVKANGGIMDFNTENGMLHRRVVLNLGAEKKR